MVILLHMNQIVVGVVKYTMYEFKNASWKPGRLYISDAFTVMVTTAITTR